MPWPILTVCVVPLTDFRYLLSDTQKHIVYIIFHGICVYSQTILCRVCSTSVMWLLTSWTDGFWYFVVSSVYGSSTTCSTHPWIYYWVLGFMLCAVSFGLEWYSCTRPARPTVFLVMIFISSQLSFDMCSHAATCTQIGNDPRASPLRICSGASMFIGQTLDRLSYIGQK